MIFKHESKTTPFMSFTKILSARDWMGLAVCSRKIFSFVWCPLFGGTCDTAWHEEDEPKQEKYNRIDHCQHLHFVILIVVIMMMMTMTMRKLRGLLIIIIELTIVFACWASTQGRH